jgi:hypothetical protein
MLSKSLLNPILNDDALTRGLGDPEARILVEYLVDSAEAACERDANEVDVAQHVYRLCRRARSISRFVRLWCHEQARGAAYQFAASERFAFPLPISAVDPCELMEKILSFDISPS